MVKKKAYSKKEKQFTERTVYLTDRQVSEMTGIATGSLQNQRWRGLGIPFYKVGQRSIRYKLEDVHAYMENGRIETRQ